MFYFDLNGNRHRAPRRRSKSSSPKERRHCLQHCDCEDYWSQDNPDYDTYYSYDADDHTSCECASCASEYACDFGYDCGCGHTGHTARPASHMRFDLNKLVNDATQLLDLDDTPEMRRKLKKILLNDIKQLRKLRKS